MKRPLLHLFIAVFLWGLHSCETERYENQEFNTTSGVFIINEGNFTYGNSSLTFLDLATGEVENQVFFKANGFPLGDVAFTMELMDTLGFISVNNSGKILVIHTGTFQHVATIGGLVSPRYIRIIDRDKAYVSDLYSDEITVVNPSDLTVTSTIHVGRTTEQMVLLQGHMFVTNWSYGNMVLKIDVNTDRLVDSLEVVFQPNSLVVDRHGYLWVLSDGGYEGIPGGKRIPALTRIDPGSMKVLHRFDFPSASQSPGNLVINGSRDTLFFLNGSWSGGTDYLSGVYRMPVNDSKLPKGPLIPEEGRLFYSLGIDPVSSMIYVTDALDYMQPGYVYRYTPDGVLTDTLKADRIPGKCAFKAR